MDHAHADVGRSLQRVVSVLLPFDLVESEDLWPYRPRGFTRHLKSKFVVATVRPQGGHVSKIILCHRMTI